MTSPPNVMHAEDFRAVMAQVPAAVSVVTTRAGGQSHGTTVSALMSLSMDPPTVLISLDNTSELLAKLERGSAVGLNVLGTGQSHIATHFAQKHKTAIGWELDEGEPPRVPGCQAWLALTIAEKIVVEDHTLVIGTVTSAHGSSDAPLIYWQRTYGTHTAA